ncbi:hypothetical protein MXMO3_01769 [Maritalea myrionectae]|uniref:Uncharacterized protein n=1 Tax=Maritalea myrionectae TaxID=454601 RepID=A0A2R4MEF2_9HYPH|nr:hypothetical protein [Maritalea myrionectae]AVX04294.1 hypothetical protein MXMO3_01769 [Maritalea myrionectae]
MTLSVQKEIWPAIGWEPIFTNGQPLWVMTVLSVNDEVGDCAAYRGICRDISLYSDIYQAEVAEGVRAGGNKISEAEARALFPEIEAKQLRYRS